MPSGGICGFNWNGFQFTFTPGGSPSSLRAFSSRRLPIQHQGQITSDTMSMVSVAPGDGEPSESGSGAVEQVTSVQARLASVMVILLPLVYRVEEALAGRRF